MKIIFFGSDDFAERHLRALLDSSHQVTACVTQPDRPKNRGMKMVLSPIKICAQEYNIPVLQPITMKDENFINQLKQYNADIFIVIAYGRILTQEILNIPPLGCINVHGSLLPQYRGAAPINWVIIDGYKKTGLSIIQMDAGMDSGDILSQCHLTILPEDTSATLRLRMMKKGAELLLETLDKYHEITPQKQEESQVTLAAKLTKDLGRIDWKQSAEDIHNLVRGLQPWPGGYTFYKEKQLKIFSTEIVLLETETSSAGTIIEINKQGFIITTGKEYLLVKEVQLSGSKRMDVVSFIRGHSLKVGYQLPS